MMQSKHTRSVHVPLFAMQHGFKCRHDAASVNGPAHAKPRT